jgi:glucose-1-phosphate thymidylyltransferase
MAWLDTGTCESLLQASNFIANAGTASELKLHALWKIAYKRDLLIKNSLLPLQYQ